MSDPTTPRWTTGGFVDAFSGSRKSRSKAAREAQQKRDADRKAARKGRHAT